MTRSPIKWAVDVCVAAFIGTVLVLGAVVVKIVSWGDSND